MRRQQIGFIIAGIVSIGFLATAALHSTGFTSVNELAAEVPSDLGPLMPALWLVFSLDLIVLGLIVALVAWKRLKTSAGILVIAALQPLGAAILQLWFIGFVPPTAILLGLSIFTIIAALLIYPRSQSTDTH